MIGSLGTDPGSKHMPSQPKRNAWVGWGWFWEQKFFLFVFVSGVLKRSCLFFSCLFLCLCVGF